MAENVRLRRSTAIELEAARFLQEQGVESGQRIMCDKRAAGEINTQDGLLVFSTNVYGLMMKTIKVYRYAVTVIGYLRSEKKVELTKPVSGDATFIDRRNQCRDVMEAFKVEHEDFLQIKNGNCLYYDLQSILYSLKELPTNTDIGTSFIIQATSIPEVDSFFTRYEVVIRRVAGDFTLGDLSTITNQLSEATKVIEQFLNLATSQYIMMKKEEFITFSSSVSYMVDPTKHGFMPEDLPIFPDNGTYLAVGAQKGVRFVEGPSGGKFAALTVEAKKTPFHGVESVLRKACYYVTDAHSIYNNSLTSVEREKLSRMLKGIRVETNYGFLKQKFFINSVSVESAAQKRFKDKNNREYTIFGYFNEKYGITLSYPNAPLLDIHMQNGRVNFFPMEVCVVSDNQRVKSQHQTGKQTQEMIKRCAIAPALLRDQVTAITRSLNLSNNAYLNAARLRFIESPLSVAGRQLPPSSLEYGKGARSSVNVNNFTWRGHQFLVPVQCKKWAAMVCEGGTRDMLSERDFTKFLFRFLTEARNRGMSLTDPTDVKFGNADPNELRNALRIAAEHQCEYVLVAHPDSSDELHAALKLYERNYLLVTQGLKIGTIRSVVSKGQPQTMQNIVNKTNVKLGGLNYSLVLDDALYVFLLYAVPLLNILFRSKEVLCTNTLYIGFGVNHPSGRMLMTNENGNDNGGGTTVAGGTSVSGNNNGSGSEHNGSGSDHDAIDFFKKTPSVVGFSANIGRQHCFEFVGDFQYQEAGRDEKIGIIGGVVARCLTAYRENRKVYPKRVVIYRNGCAEGQFSNILKYEIPLVKLEIQKAGCEATLTVIVVNKLQGVRFFRSNMNERDRSVDQNIQPGTVVDTNVVHPIYCEFFLNSHRALQGTARTPKYTVLYDESRMTMNQMQTITYHLCYGHQIVFMPTSLPSPVYIAMRYAERGSLLYARYRSTSSSDNNEMAASYAELTERLSYEHVNNFVWRRINA